MRLCVAHLDHEFAPGLVVRLIARNICSKCDTTLSAMTPRPNPTIHRTGSESSQSSSIKKRTTNFLTDAQKHAAPAMPPKYQASYPVYACPWDKLKTWLERTFPGHTFDEWVGGDSGVRSRVPKKLMSCFSTDQRRSACFQDSTAFDRCKLSYTLTLRLPHIVISFAPAHLWPPRGRSGRHSRN